MERRERERDRERERERKKDSGRRERRSERVIKSHGARIKPQSPVCVSALHVSVFHCIRALTVTLSQAHSAWWAAEQRWHASSLSPVLKHCCHQSLKAPEHGPRCVCHHFSLNTQLDCTSFVLQPDKHTHKDQPMRLTQPRLETLLPSKPKGSGTRTKVCLSSLQPEHSTRLHKLRPSTRHAYTQRQTHAAHSAPS